MVSATNLRSLAPQRLSRFKAFSTALSAYTPSLKISRMLSITAKHRFLWSLIFRLLDVIRATVFSGCKCTNLFEILDFYLITYYIFLVRVFSMTISLNIYQLIHSFSIQRIIIVIYRKQISKQRNCVFVSGLFVILYCNSLVVCH